MRKTYDCKSIQKDYVMQKKLENYHKSNTKGLRNAERARKFIQKNTNERNCSVQYYRVHLCAFDGQPLSK